MRDKQMMQRIDNALARANPVPMEEISHAASSLKARALLGRILRTPPDSVRGHAANTGIGQKWRLTGKAWAGIGTVAAAATAITAITISAQAPGQFAGHTTPRQSAAARSHTAVPPVHLVDFTQRNGSIVVKITDPNAPVGQLNAIFKAHRLNIRINVVPVSPSLVSTIIYSDINAARELQGGTCEQGGGGSCWIGFTLPADFTGSGDLTVGRAAQPGEQYESTDSVFSPKEALYGSGLAGRPARDALPVLRARHLSVLWMINSLWTRSTAIPDGTITDGMGWNSNTVVLNVSVPGYKAILPLPHKVSTPHPSASH